MNLKSVKRELQDVISGKSGHSHDAAIQAVARYLRGGQSTSPMAKGKLQNKKEEAESLIAYARKMKLLRRIRTQDYISEGAEQKVFIKNERSVIKLNDAIYYAS